MAAARVARPRLWTVVSALLAFAAAGLLGVRVESQDSGTGSVGAWLTTVDRANLLAPQAGLSFQPDSGRTRPGPRGTAIRGSRRR